MVWEYHGGYLILIPRMESFFIWIKPFPAAEPETRSHDSQHQGVPERSGLFLRVQAACDGRQRIDYV